MNLPNQFKKNVEKLGKHLQGYETFHIKLGNSLATTVNHYKNAHKELKKVDKDVMNITESEKVLKLDEVDIEKTQSEE